VNRHRALLIMTVSVAAVYAGVVATLSHATAPGTNGRIAFQRYRLHDAPLQAEIFTVNSDGSGERKVTHVAAGAVDGEPDWAPDGSRIVFQRCGRLPCHIWSVRPDGSGLKRLSSSCPRGSAPPKCVDDSSPVYSPDGRHIAFVRYRSPKSNGLVVADANLRHAHPVGPGWEPGWSPDGKQLVFAWKPGNRSAIYVANADGSGRHRVTPFRLRAGDHPDWSPDGTRILFNTGRTDRWNLFTVRSDGTGLRQLTHFQGVTKVVNGSYSPDGESIVFSTVVGAVNPSGASLDDVFVMSADGTDIRPVTRARNWDGSPDWGPRR
jgi:Tol biopolymer transport system component